MVTSLQKARDQVIIGRPQLGSVQLSPRIPMISFIISFIVSCTRKWLSQSAIWKSSEVSLPFFNFIASTKTAWNLQAVKPPGNPGDGIRETPLHGVAKPHCSCSYSARTRDATKRVAKGITFWSRFQAIANSLGDHRWPKDDINCYASIRKTAASCTAVCKDDSADQYQDCVHLRSQILQRSG